jgi:RNA polymerase sigma-70 factor (TIGR02960 family)
MARSLLDGARSGDQDAYRELIAPFERELHLHCYRMLGSVADADDLLQETMLAAWQGLAGFAGRSSLRAWLYRIATNRCLNAIRATRRRPPPAPLPPFEPPEPSRHGDVTWLQPYPDAWLDPAPEPSARYQGREAVRLGFVTALQRLPPRQTAALILCDVLDFSPAEAAAMIDATPAAVKGLLQRARGALEQQHAGGEHPAPEPRSPAEADLARRFAEAYSADDIETLIALLSDDAWLSMPPAPHEYHGPIAIAAFLRASMTGRAGRHFRLVPTRANAQPAFACYLDSPGQARPRPAGLVVLTLAGRQVTAVTRFLDTPAMPKFRAGPGALVHPGPVFR